MEKVAELVKQAEVNGVVAALCEAGYVKVASEEEFEMLADCVAEKVAENYDLDDVIAKTAEVLEEVYGDEMEKDAGEVDEAAVMAAFGELSMMKEAGEIDEDTFEKEAASLKELWESTKGMASRSGKRVRIAAKKTKRFAKRKGDDVKDAYKRVKESTKAERVAAGLGAGLGAAAGAGAAVGGAALYKKYKNKK